MKSLASQSKKEYKSWSLKEQLAFWINAYNGLTLKLIINHYPIQSSFFKSLAYPKNSIRQISGAWDSITHDVMGEKLTLDTIEHKILRKYFHEPRIHMALVCAAMGCPPLRNEPYLPSKLDSQLDDQTKKFLSNNKKFKIDRKEKIVYLSAIFSWFGKDFVEKYGTKTKFKDHSEPERAVLNFISSYLSKDDKEFLEKEKYSISYFKYDWSLNEQK
ncbi:MAG: DUF547 domain-containing protein [Planctomycetota bacterium]|nr:MAG: DUF547 domain-containing protein [Planctomycetota bacterium]